MSGFLFSIGYTKGGVFEVFSASGEADMDILEGFVGFESGGIAVADEIEILAEPLRGEQLPHTLRERPQTLEGPEHGFPAGEPLS